MKTTLTLSLRAVALCSASLFLASASLAQTASSPTPSAGAALTAAEKDASSARKWSIYWGWNRSTYSNSDIHFSGADHDFTIRDVAGADMQTDATWANVFAIYLRPSEITIPQTNMRLAYQYSKDIAVALNLDHMKYVMGQNQSVPISGQIKGVNQSGQQVLTEQFLTYEHTDGLNIISIELEKQYPVDLFGPKVPSRLFALAGVGLVVPKSNVTMGVLGRTRNDEFHLAGYSAGVGGGLEVDFCKDFFFRTAYKAGYVNLPDVRTSSKDDKASQSFTYNEWLIAAGWRF
jgi:hypothetical protein